MPVKIGPVLIFVKRFERCLVFYRETFRMKPVLLYRGAKHPRFAVLESENMLLELHGGYRGRPHRIEPVAIHFEVEDLQAALQKVRSHRGTIKRPAKEVEWFPQKLRVLEATFADPDGNEFEIFQKV